MEHHGGAVGVARLGFFFQEVNIGRLLEEAIYVLCDLIIGDDVNYFYY